jgi:hypothetical protein
VNGAKIYKEVERPARKREKLLNDPGQSRKSKTQKDKTEFEQKEAKETKGDQGCAFGDGPRSFDKFPFARVMFDESGPECCKRRCGRSAQTRYPYLRFLLFKFSL